MPLPIAVGGVSLSSERIKGPFQPPSSVPTPVAATESQPPHQSVTWAVCPWNEWQARIVVSFYDEDIESESNNNQRLPQQQKRNRRRMVEIRIQISPLVRALSAKAYRETKYHLELFTNDDCDNEDNVNVNRSNDSDDESFSSESQSENQRQEKETHRQPQVVFSQDRLHLMVLLFQKNKNPNQCPEQHQQSSIVVFQLRKPKSSSTLISSKDRSNIPLPYYIAKETPNSSGGSNTNGEFTGPPNNPMLSSNPNKGSPVVATYPKVVPSSEGITAICRLGGKSTNPTVFLAAKNDGTLHWINTKSAEIEATAALPNIVSNNRFVASMNASPTSTSDRGMVALVIAPSNSALYPGSNASQSSASCDTDYDEIDVDDIGIGISIDSSIESVSSSGDSSRNADGRRVKGGDCVLIEWSKTSMANTSQKRTTRNDLEHPHEIHNADESESHAVDAIADEPLLMIVSAPAISPKRHSSAGSDKGLGVSSAMMLVRLLSVWSPPLPNGEKNEARVSDICFGSLSSVLCVVYHHTNQEFSSGPRQKMAQILSISANSVNGTRYDLVPTVSLYLSLDQVEQAPSVANRVHMTIPHSDENSREYRSDDEEYSMVELSSDEKSSNEIRKENPFGTKIESRMVGIQYDPGSDSFVISSIFGGNRGKNDHWVGCVWNWRANAIGWMVQHEISPFSLSSSLRKNSSCSNDGISWSRLYFARDPYNGGGSHLVCIDSSLRYNGTNDYDNGNRIDSDNSTILETRKRTVLAAMLSPDNFSNPGVFAERSSLLLAKTHVSFPSVATKDSESTIRELDWKISALPLSYTASQGPPRIAAMGPTQAKSIAVASVRGVCILDTYHNKWRQFGSPSEERSFSVISMTWWEGSSKGKGEDERDDLLVAITKTRAGEQFLSCWSSKRLDRIHQLIDTPDQVWKPGESQNPEPSWGIPLPKDVRITNISLLSEPELEQSDGNANPRRAIALVYSPDLATAECNYLVFRLQVFRNKVSSSHSSEVYIARRPFYVMAHKVVQANMKNNMWSGPVTSIFIASACFQFDLRQSKNYKAASQIEEGDFVATLGVARSPGGIQAVCIFENGETCVASLSNFEVSRYQLSDRVLSGVHSSGKQIQIVRFVWTIELLNGNAICWSVPSIVGSQPDRLNTLEVDSPTFEETHNHLSGRNRPKGLDRPLLVCKENSSGKNESWILGTLCVVGNVSDWAIQSTFGCQFDISLGQVPQSTFGCVLRSGQNSQKFARRQIGGIDNQIFSSNILEVNSYSQSPFTITPPAFVISLYALLLEGAFLQMDLHEAEPLSQVEDLKNRLKIIQGQIQHRLTSARNTDSAMMALRLIIFRSLEMIANTHKMHSKKPSEYTESNLLLSKSLLSKTIVATRRCTSALQFASLFLEVGRQTEPSNLQHLFPLPLPDKLAESAHDPDITEARSVIDLFTICIDEGSLAASASALPLLTSKAQARYYCELLLDEAIDNFVRNSAPSQCTFDSTEEERRVIGDFFRFGMKLEDAEIYDEKLEDSTSLEGSMKNLGFHPESPENVKRNLICNFSASSSIFNYIVPSSMRGESEKQRIEDAIRREASSFIKQSLDQPGLDFAMLPNWDDSFSPTTNRGDTNGVAYLVGVALLDLLRAENTNNNWKVIAAFAKMILQEGIKIPTSYNLFAEVVDKALPLDVLSIVPETYDVNNGLEENMSTYIREGISACCTQITVADANHIINMSLLLIDRVNLLPLSDVGDQGAMELGLVYIIMVAGDISGRKQSIQDMIEQDSLLNKCYKLATSTIK